MHYTGAGADAIASEVDGGFALALAAGRMMSMKDCMCAGLRVVLDIYIAWKDCNIRCTISFSRSRAVTCKFQAHTAMIVDGYILLCFSSSPTGNVH